MTCDFSVGFSYLDTLTVDYIPNLAKLPLKTLTINIHKNVDYSTYVYKNNKTTRKTIDFSIIPNTLHTLVLSNITLQNMPTMKNLRSLSLIDCNMCDTAQNTIFSGLEITYLNISNSIITGIDFAPLIHLKMFIADSTSIDDAALLNMKELRYISLKNCANIKGIFAKNLPKVQKIKVDRRLKPLNICCTADIIYC